MSARLVSSMQPQDRVLTISGVVSCLKTMGLEDATAEKVRHWAKNKKLPFFKDPSGRNVIMESVVRRHFTDQQKKAQDDIEREKLRAGRGKRK